MDLFFFYYSEFLYIWEVNPSLLQAKFISPLHPLSYSQFLQQSSFCLMEAAESSSFGKDIVFQSLDAFLCGPWISGYKCSQNWPCAWLRPQGGTPEAIPHQCWRSIEEMSRGNWWDYYEWMTTALVHERGEVISLISTSTFLSLAFPEWLLKWHWKRRQFPNDATKRSSWPHCVLHALLLLAIGNCCLLPVSWGNAKTYPANLWLCTHKVAIISR